MARRNKQTGKRRFNSLYMFPAFIVVETDDSAVTALTGACAAAIKPSPYYPIVLPDSHTALRGYVPISGVKKIVQLVGLWLIYSLMAWLTKAANFGGLWINLWGYNIQTSGPVIALDRISRLSIMKTWGLWLRLAEEIVTAPMRAVSAYILGAAAPRSLVWGVLGL